MSNSSTIDYRFLPKCTCNRRCDLDSESSDDFDNDDNLSYTDEESKDESSNSVKFFFISVYKYAFLKNTIIVSDVKEIETYRLKYSELTDKSVANVKNIFDSITVNVPLLGAVTLKSFIEHFCKVSVRRKKQLKRPLPSMKLQNINSENSDTTNTQKSSSTVQLQKAKANLKEENNNSNEKNTDKKVQEVKANSIPHSEDKKINIKIGYNLDINNKIPQTVNNIDKNKDLKINNTAKSKELLDKEKNQTLVNSPKSPAIKGKKSSSALNNIKANINKNQEANSVNNSPSKIILENKNENRSAIKNENNKNKDKEKLNSANQNNTPKKLNMVNKSESVNLTNSICKVGNTPDKVLKINTSKQTGKNEIKKSVNEPKSPSVAEKFEKKDLTNTPSKKGNTGDKNQDANNTIKQSEPEFKKPLDVKPILNNTENNLHEDTVDKTTKKQLKKQRQKEKKMERNRRDSSNCSSRDTTDNSSPDSKNSIKNNVKKSKKIILEELKKTGKKQEEMQHKGTAKNHVQVDTEESEVDNNNKDEDESEYMRTSDDEMDFLTDDDNLPVFLAKIKEKCKSKEKTKLKPEVSTNINSNSTETKDLANGNNGQEFVIYTKKRNKPVSNHVINQDSIFYSNSFAENACRMILENNFIGALEYLVNAINFNYTDQRHYLNRCYCYLSMKKNALALADAKYIIQVSSNIGYLFIANVRAAQASYYLQKYEQAEHYMKEAIRINSTSVYAERELILIQVARIVSMGFSEKDALLALEKYSSVQRAVDYLIKDDTEKLYNSKKEDSEFSLDNCDELVYSSDEDEPSSTEIVNRMLNYNPGTIKFQHIVANPANMHLLINDNGKSIKKEKVLLNGKANAGQGKAIWVGNLTTSITDIMLKKKFKEFGKVISVYRPLNEAYAFVNFEKAEDVTSVLTNTPCPEIAGIKLVVKSATRQK